MKNLKLGKIIKENGLNYDDIANTIYDSMIYKELAKFDLSKVSSKKWEKIAIKKLKNDYYLSQNEIENVIDILRGEDYFDTGEIEFNESKDMKKSKEELIVEQNLKSIMKKPIKEEVSFENGIVTDYDFKKGEEVLVKHKTWDKPRTMIVTKPGIEPTLKYGSIEIELLPQFKKRFEMIVPVALEDEYKKSKRKLRASVWREKFLTHREYEKEIKDAISGHEYDDHSIIYDLAENLVNSNSEIIKYIVKKARNSYSVIEIPRTKRDVIEIVVNDMERYAK